MLLNGAKDISLSPGAEFFTADKSYMYANIVFYTGLQIFQKHFNDCNEKIQATFPKQLFLKKIKLVMENSMLCLVKHFGYNYLALHWAHPQHHYPHQLHIVTLKTHK